MYISQMNTFQLANEPVPRYQKTQSALHCLARVRYPRDSTTMPHLTATTLLLVYTEVLLEIL